MYDLGGSNYLLISKGKRYYASFKVIKVGIYFDRTIFFKTFAVLLYYIPYISFK